LSNGTTVGLALNTTETGDTSTTTVNARTAAALAVTETGDNFSGSLTDRSIVALTINAIEPKDTASASVVIQFPIAYVNITATEAKDIVRCTGLILTFNTGDEEVILAPPEPKTLYADGEDKFMFSVQEIRDMIVPDLNAGYGQPRRRAM
jgi:hypothetical protein